MWWVDQAAMVERDFLWKKSIVLASTACSRIPRPGASKLSIEAAASLYSARGSLYWVGNHPVLDSEHKSSGLLNCLPSLQICPNWHNLPGATEVIVKLETEVLSSVKKYDISFYCSSVLMGRFSTDRSEKQSTQSELSPLWSHAFTPFFVAAQPTLQ